MKRLFLSALLILPVAAMAQETPATAPLQVNDAGVYQEASIVPEDPFTITGVVVDVTGKNAVEARAKAFAEGSQIAVQKFLAAQGAQASLGNTKPESLVRDFRVDKEQFSRTRYTASLTYRFKPRAMAILANASLPADQALPVPSPETLPSTGTADPNGAWVPEKAADPTSAERLTTWPLTVHFNEVPEWLQAQSLITARPEIRGYKVVSMSGNAATLEITTAGGASKTAQTWSAMGWPVTPNGSGLALNAAGLHR